MSRRKRIEIFSTNVVENIGGGIWNGSYYLDRDCVDNFALCLLRLACHLVHNDGDRRRIQHYFGFDTGDTHAIKDTQQPEFDFGSVGTRVQGIDGLDEQKTFELVAQSISSIRDIEKRIADCADTTGNKAQGYQG